MPEPPGGIGAILGRGLSGQPVELWLRRLLIGGLLLLIALALAGAFRPAPATSPRSGGRCRSPAGR